MPAARYYQIGGFRPHIRWFENDWNDDQLVETLAGQNSPLRPSPDRPLELVLGIGPKGTSHLLLADIQISTFGRAGPRRQLGFTTLADYASVSPIRFDSPDDLKHKLKSLRPKKRKGKKEDPWDTSQANKAFTSGDQGIQRGEFEHGRMLYYLLGSVVNPAVYSVPDTLWTTCLRVTSFVCNLRLLDGRSYGVKQQSPRPLDYGWAEADVSYPQLPLKQGSAVHIIRSDDRTLQAGRRQVPFEHGTTQIIEWKSTTSLARQFFRTLHESPEPVIILVYNEDLALRALSELGVQTSEWKSGIGDLLRGQDPIGRWNEGAFEKPKNHPRRARDDPVFEHDRQRSRDRSRSPRPRKVGPDDALGQLRRLSPPLLSSTSARVYVVDVQALYRTLMQSQSDRHIGDLAQNLGVIEKGDVWCAGNEAVYLLQAWHSMISGASIDEQRASRVATARHHHSTATNVPLPEERGPLYDGDSEDEFDPNDIVQMTDTAQKSQAISYEADWSSSDDD